MIRREAPNLPATATDVVREKSLTPAPLSFELSVPGRRAARFPQSDVPAVDATNRFDDNDLAASPPHLPELSEPQVVRHYVNLSTRNMSVDTHFYPLGSCTMKYNPKRNERNAALPGFANLHPYQPDDAAQGMLSILHAVQEALAGIAGLDAASLQPAAGAHGELTALLCAAAYFKDHGLDRKVVLVPDSAHGTNPASAAIAGFETREVKSTAAGFVDVEDLKSKIDDRLAAFMITNPNTLGLFEPNIRKIADLVHEAGGLIYLDGANMNAIMGWARPGDFGADMMHYNPHKTFSGPHGGGGPGAGPIAVRDILEPYLPTPLVVKETQGRQGFLSTRRGVRAAEIDRAGARLFRQHGRVASRLLLHPQLRAGRSEGGLGRRGPQRQLPQGTREGIPAGRQSRTLHA